MSEEIAIVPTPPAEAPAASDLQHPNMFRDLVETMVLVAIAFLAINALIGRFRIEQVSMQPNLHEGEYVIVDKVSYSLRQPERGEIVVLKNPTPGQPDLIKRVIGLPGETIEVRGGAAYINGQPLTEPYIAQPMTTDFPATLLQANQYFVMGDNRNNSEDSRRFGARPLSDIVGRAWIIYWPPAEWQILSRPTYAAPATP
ncbi:MAG TPA: signal peptidase I [Anaerolineae bacterium]|nr:signal peptidase I [Anaerolineae bacterium]